MRIIKYWPMRDELRLKEGLTGFELTFQSCIVKYFMVKTYSF